MASNVRDLLEELYWDHYEVVCRNSRYGVYDPYEWRVSIGMAGCHIERTGLDLYDIVVMAKTELDQYLNKEHTA